MNARRIGAMMCLGVVALLIIGLFELTSTSVHTHEHEDPRTFLQLQTAWITLGVLAAIFCAVVDYRRWRTLRWGIYGLSILLLILTLVPALNVDVNGENRWLKLPGLPQFQASETSKIAVMVILAAWFGQRESEVQLFLKGFVYPALLLALPVVLIFVQTDMGTAVCLAAAGGLLMFMAGTRLRYLILVFAIAASGLTVAVLNNPNRLERVIAIISPESIEDPQERRDRTWQQDRAKISFQNGGLTGRGIYEGSEKSGTLPYAHTDFIFAAVGEEMGLLATVGIVVAFLLLLLGGTRIASCAPDQFGRLLALGLMATILVPALLNMCVVTGLVPNSGLPLPFVSYGGTNLITTLAAFGILLNICRHSHERASDADIASLKARRAAARL